MRETAGRPRSSSRGTLEEAALELFIEQGYNATTIEHITQRAGVSRNTFFNYFGAKSDLLWLEVDAGIARLSDELGCIPADAATLSSLRDAVIRVAREVSEDRVPLALTQGDVMGRPADAFASGLARFASRAEVVGAFLAHRLGASPRDLSILAASNALAGALSAAWEAWADAGVTRRPLAEYVCEAYDLVVRGLEATLDRERR